MYFGMLRGDRCVAAYVHGPQGQVLGAFRLKTIQKINCKEINAKIKTERKKNR
jgi:predicted transcriptional regulator